MYTFTAVLFFAFVFVIWILYMTLREKDGLEKEFQSALKSKEKLQKTYETKQKEQKDNEEKKTEMHSGGVDGFNASLDLVQKYADKK